MSRSCTTHVTYTTLSHVSQGGKLENCDRLHDQINKNKYVQINANKADLAANDNERHIACYTM